MMIDPALPVIAVFGRNGADDAELLAAGLLGVAVNRSMAVLLTGGDRIQAQTVKDTAIWTADGAGTPETPATWVGVARKGEALPLQSRGPRSIVVTPGWLDRRNFVEACLCDAAIAIGGNSDGTSSEALFCLYLGRPVVIVGDLPEDELAPSALRERALDRIGWPQQPILAVDLGIAAAYSWADHPDAAAQRRPMPTDADSAAALVTELIERITARSRRTRFEDLVDEATWDANVRTALGDADR